MTIPIRRKRKISKTKVNKVKSIKSIEKPKPTVVSGQTPGTQPTPSRQAPAQTAPTAADQPSGQASPSPVATTEASTQSQASATPTEEPKGILRRGVDSVKTKISDTKEGVKTYLANNKKPLLYAGMGVGAGIWGTNTFGGTEPQSQTQPEVSQNNQMALVQSFQQEMSIAARSGQPQFIWSVDGQAYATGYNPQMQRQQQQQPQQSEPKKRYLSRVNSRGEIVHEEYKRGGLIKRYR